MKQRRETKRTGSGRRGAPFEFSVHYRKRFSSRVTFRIPVVRGKTSARLIPATCGAARRDEARRGEAGGGGGARVDVPLVLILIHVEKEPPL
jgi:hypothetical protein